MYLFPPLPTLLPYQTRMIDARAGLRLEVLEGCLWLTRPGDATDRFVQAGGSLELHECLVLIQSEAPGAGLAVGTACYRLVPLADARSALAHSTPQRSVRAPWRWWPIGRPRLA